MTWARKRWEHGLGGLGLPWQEGEDAWLLAGQLQSRTEEGSGAQACPGEHDLPPDALADPDSRWAHCGALRVHYKLALPLVSVRSGHAAGAAKGLRQGAHRGRFATADAEVGALAVLVPAMTFRSAGLPRRAAEGRLQAQGWCSSTPLEGGPLPGGT